MKTKLVLWGTNAEKERILIALELLPEENFVNVYTFPEAVATEEFSQKMLDVWRDGGEVEFPEGYEVSKKELSVSGNLLPEGLEAERSDIVQRAQTEWHFMVLSTKLNQAYVAELNTLRDQIDKLDRYDTSVWESLKSFWEKVQVQVKDRNLLKDHANSLRESTNELFAKLKELRAKLDEEFNQRSKDNHDKFMEILQGVEEKVQKGLRLQSIFDELKGIQRKFRESKLTREHRSKVWERLDAAFKSVKEKRFGASANEDRSPLERLQRRYDGLLSAIEKMQRSIKRDEDDLDFQNRKIANSDGQLEAQIRQAKIKMIEERINSKQEKLGEMRVTQKELEDRMAKQKEKDAKRKEQEKLEEAKKQAEAEIAKKIQKAAAARKDEEEKLEKAAESLKKPPKKQEAEEATDEAAQEPAEKQEAGEATDEAAQESTEKQEATATPEAESKVEEAVPNTPEVDNQQEPDAKPDAQETEEHLKEQETPQEESADDNSSNKEENDKAESVEASAEDKQPSDESEEEKK